MTLRPTGADEGHDAGGASARLGAATSALTFAAKMLPFLSAQPSFDRAVMDADRCCPTATHTGRRRLSDSAVMDAAVMDADRGASARLGVSARINWRSPPVSGRRPARPGPDTGQIRVGSVGAGRASHWDAQAAGPSPSPIILV